MPTFELWDKRAAGRARTPTITVQRKGILSLNAGAAHLIAGDGEVHDELGVEILFDPKERIIALRRAKEEHTSVYTMRKQKASNSYLLSIRAFTIYHKIDTTKSRRYVAHDYGNGAIGIALNESFSEVSRATDNDNAGEE
jgi:hypothetical protein